MLFNTYAFLLLFLPIAWIGYFSINHFQKYEMAKLFLLLMCCIFCGYYNWHYALVMGISILINFGIGKLFQKEERVNARKIILAGGLILNIGALLYFKYFDFFVENINSIFHTGFNLRNVILPLGISFFTFQQIAYLVDCYRNEAEKYCLLDYALFIAFFPKMSQGPIAFHSELIPQFNDGKRKTINYENMSRGIYAFACGVAKKVLLADLLGQVVDLGYADTAALTSTNAFLVMLAYTLQIYFDFSGYCDMAAGISLMFNIELPLNFDSPYKAFTITEFWDRWHMTLTRFFTKYIYIPLGGNRKGKIRTYINIMIVFLISGLWHGAAWTFVFWGFLHGVASVLTRIFKERIEKMHAALKWVLTFGFVNVAWVFFRAPSMQDAIQVLKSIVSFNGNGINTEIAKTFEIVEFNVVFEMLKIKDYIDTYFPNICLVVIMTICLVIILGFKNTMEKIDDFKPSFLNGVWTVILLVWSILSFTGVSTFLYFGF